ncbi:oxidoreductase-like protein [Xylariomycetidae sp. FL2044]|nr:oxidoreductase-like protein [Xylariomycetidae sp. FL2044]
METSYPPRTPQNGADFTTTTHSSSYRLLRTANHVGHRVLITGATRGIGRATALSFARAGARAIAVADISESFDKLANDLLVAAKENGHDYPQLVLTRLDVTDEESVRKCAATISNEFEGRLDVLVNNAGFMTSALPVPEADADSWWRTLEVNLRGVFLMSKHFIPLLLASQQGPRTMINLSSVAAHNLRPMASAYGVSKLAVLKLSEFLMVEGASKGFLTYSIHPGAILTELAEKGMPADTLAGLTDSADLAGDTIAWLSSEHRDWLAGRYLSATWDMKELLDRKAEIVNGDKLKVRLVV